MKTKFLPNIYVKQSTTDYRIQLYYVPLMLLVIKTKKRGLFTAFCQKP